MPGLYVVPTRPAGTLITELVYNNDHQNHVDGRAAEFMGSYGVSSSQFQLTEDPYPNSVESFPPSLAGEITRMRFVLAQIITELSGGVSANWYDSIVAPGIATIGARIERNTDISIPNNFGTVISFSGGAENFNSGVYDDASQPTRFTAPIAGKYMAFCAVEWQAASGGRRQLQIGVNGSFSSQAVISNKVIGSSQVQTQALTGFVNLAANDYVQFAAFQNSGSALNIVGDTPRSIAGGMVFLGS
jgi:hypothetical protein